MDENIAFGNAWRYRDYVVRAFNDDKPFDQFLIEQIAGDLLPPQRGGASPPPASSRSARGCSRSPTCGSWRWTSSTSRSTRSGKAFLGMTLGCARCHDHKFDPIPQEDYYALAAIFRSTRSLADGEDGRDQVLV